MNQDSLQGKQLTVFVTFVANDRNLVFKSKAKFWKTFICHCELGSFSILNEFLHEISGDINECDFLIYITKCFIVETSE